MTIYDDDLDVAYEVLAGEGRRVPNVPSYNETPLQDVEDSGMFARLIDGADWLLEGGNKPEPIWGTSDQLLAVRHQPTVIAGPQGAGKTVIGQRIMLGAIGVAGFDHLLAHPVTPIDGKALYLAADRPDQARLSMLRMVDPEEVRGRLTVWKGPPPANIVTNTLALLQLVEQADAAFLLIDSLKDVALRLSDDEVGSAVNQAIQHVIAAGIEVVALHHPRKLGGDDGASKPRRLDDLYGSTWLTAGAGSVLYLHPLSNGHVELEQFKTPNGNEARINFRHDHAAGAVATSAGSISDVANIISDAGHEGITVMHIARCLVGASHATDATRKSVERAVKKLEESGRVEKVPGATKATEGLKWRTVVGLP